MDDPTAAVASLSSNASRFKSRDLDFFYELATLPD